MNDDVLVTGGTGFIGSYLVRRLVDEGHSVTVFDNEFRSDTGGGLTEVEDKITTIEGDVRDKEAVTDLPAVDRIFHLAAINGTKNFYEMPYDVIDVNTKGVQNILTYAADSSPERVVFASSSEVYGFPTNFPTSEEHVLQLMNSENPRYSYAASKIAGEVYTVNMARQSEFDYTILRPHNVYGPRMGYDHVIPEFIQQIVTDEEFTIYGDGEQTRSFCYISDAIDMMIAAGFQTSGANEIFNLGNDEEVTINELAEEMFEICGNEEVRYITDKELEGSPERRQPDVSKARERLDYEASVPLEEGLAETVEWYRRDIRERNKN